jgi:hypothetical protein
MTFIHGTKEDMGSLSYENLSVFIGMYCKAKNGGYQGNLQPREVIPRDFWLVRTK